MIPSAASAPLILFFVLGLCIGSFGNVVIGRLPAGESLNGRSQCPRCKRVLGVRELVPVLSWLWLRARCKGCRKPISAQYPLIELLTGTLFALAFMISGFSPLPAGALAMAFWAMLMIVVIDTRTQMIPDVLTLTLAAASAVHQALLTGVIDLTGACTGVAFLGLQWIISRGKWIGSGDVLLVGALGLLLGSWVDMTVALFASYILGTIIISFLLLTKKLGRKSLVPFGPFLILGTLLAYFWGDLILSSILR